MVATNMLVVVSRTVFRKRGQSISDTGTLRRMDRPRSPRKILPSQRKYWTCKGWSRPQRVRSCSIDSLVAVGLAITLMGSPGTRCTSKKTTTEMMIRTGIACSSLCRRYLSKYPTSSAGWARSLAHPKQLMGFSKEYGRALRRSPTLPENLFGDLGLAEDYRPAGQDDQTTDLALVRDGRLLKVADDPRRIGDELALDILQ